MMMRDEMMDCWLDANGRFFSSELQVSLVSLGANRPCVILDNVLANPEGVIDWAASQRFVPPQDNFYPGQVLEMPTSFTRYMVDLFQFHARARLGGWRTQEVLLRLSMVTTPPHQLLPAQWQCHRDCSSDAPEELLYAASVLYLFRDPAQGGTSFYEPRHPLSQIDRMMADSLILDSEWFTRRYGVHPGYMLGSNAHFERIAQVPAAWNRMIFYDGSIFHSGDIGTPDTLQTDPRNGRLTMNGFFNCRRKTSAIS